MTYLLLVWRFPFSPPFFFSPSSFVLLIFSGCKRRYKLGEESVSKKNESIYLHCFRNFSSQVMLEFILAVLIGCGRVNSAILSNSSASTSPELEWWRTLPRALIPNGPLTRTDLPTVLLVDQHPPPTIKPQPLTGREGALIYLYQNPFTTLTDPSLASKCGAQWSAESSEYIQSGRITTYSGQPARYADQWNYIPKSPCCGQCSIDGMSAELRYWPTPAPTPAVTAIVDNSGFT